MSTGKTYSTKYLLDSNNNRGSEGQILSTTSTGIDWVDANTVPGTGLWVTSGNNIYNSNSGNVGIKTTSPANPLSINFAPNGISSITTSNNSTAWNTSSAIMLEGASNSNGLGFGVSGTANDRKSWIQSGHPDQQYASSLGTLAINPLGGNVGIGTTSPLAKLHAKSGDSGVSSVDTGTSAIIESDTTNYLRFLNPDSANAGLVWTSPSDNFAAYLRWKYSSRVLEMATAKTNSSISFSTGNADERMRITSAGNVGIGTTSPGSRLTVSGTNNATSEITLINTNPSTDNDWSITPFYNDQTLRFRTNSAATTVMTLKDNGNVGIGTTSPSKKLTVYGGNDNGIWVDSSGSQYTSIAWGNNGTEKANIAYDNTNANFVLSAYGASDTVFSNNGSEKMRIDSAGNVGIGTTSPQSGGGSAKWLSLNGTAAYSGGIVYTVNSATKAYSYFESDYLKQQAQSGFGQKFIVNGTTTAMTILSDGNATFSGNVAVNGTNVTVANASNPYIYINDTNAGAGIFQQEGNTTRIGSDSNTQVVLVQNNATAVTIDTDKNVGINTTSPDFKLDVDGTFGVSDLPFNTDSVSVLVANETIGADLVTNGDFATNTDWTEQGGAAAWSIANGKANCVVNSSTRYFEQPNVLPSSGPGNTYKVVYTISGITQGQFQINIGGYGATPGRTTNGTYAETFTTTNASANNRIYLQSSPNTIGSIDNISVQLVTSASNQIQKRELGTGAFGPTPVGAYLPLSAGSGEILTGDLAMNNNIGIITKDSSGAFRDILKLNSSNVLEIGSSSLATNTIFKNSGNVGIGTTTPGDALVVKGGSPGNIDLVSFQNNAGNETHRFYTDSANDGVIETVTNAGVTANLIQSSGNSYLNGGNVGINTTSPGDKLHVEGGIIIQNGNNLQWGGLYSAGAPTIYASTNYLHFVPTGSSGSGYRQMRLDTTGLGIGTSSPSEKLDVAGNIKIQAALLSNQENTDIDSAAAEVVAQVAHATYTAAFFDFVVKKGTNVRSGTVYACHNGDTTPLVEFTETSTNDLGDTSDVVLSVDISGANMRLLATVTSDDWSVKSLIRAI